MQLIGQPAAAARDPDRIDVLAIGDDDKLWRRWWDGKTWVAWQPVSGTPPALDEVAASWAGARLDVYARDGSGDLWYLALE